VASLSLTLEELWWVQNLVRRTDHLGACWDNDDMRKVHAGILVLSDKPPDAEHALDVGDGFVWLMENQIPQTLDLGRSNLGRRILLKVMAALCLEDEYPVQPIPDIFRALGAEPEGDDDDGRDECASADDTGTDGDAGEASTTSNRMSTATDGTTKPD
jgi:hypothetical protein